MGRRGNNEGSVYKRKDGRWCAAVTTGYAPDTGKPIRAYYYGDTRSEVVAKRDEALNQVKAGTYVKPTKQTVGEWLKTWLDTYVAPTVRPKTWEGHEYRIRYHLQPDLGPIELRSLQTNQVQKMLNHKIKDGLSARTTELILITLRMALKQALVEGLVTRDVSEHVKKPKSLVNQKKSIRVLTVAEMNAFVAEAMKDRWGWLFAVMLGTGLRMGEVVALEWKSVDLKGSKITVAQGAVQTKTPDSKKRVKLIQDPKTSAGVRTIPMTNDVAFAFKQWKKVQATEKLKLGETYVDSGRVFTTSIGTPLLQRNIARKLERIAGKANIEHVNPHALRHTFATRLLERGVHPKVVQELLGHKDVTLTLNTYSHVMPDIKQAAARSMDGMLNIDTSETDKPKKKRVAVKLLSKHKKLSG